MWLELLETVWSILVSPLRCLSPRKKEERDDAHVQQALLMIARAVAMEAGRKSSSGSNPCDVCSYPQQR